MTDRVECHCGWVYLLTCQAQGSPAGTNVLERHHQEVHGLGTVGFYRPAPWCVPDPNPFPLIRLIG